MKVINVLLTFLGSLVKSIIGKNSKILRILKGLFYFRLPGNKYLIANYKELKRTRSRFYLFQINHLIVAFDSGSLNDNRGIGRIAKNIFNELSKKIYLSKACNNVEFHIRQLDDCDPDQIDFYFFSSIHWVDSRYLSKSVIMIMDTIPLDLNLYFPKADVKQWRELFRDYAQRSIGIITISEWSAGRISKHLDIALDKIKVIPPGVNHFIPHSIYPLLNLKTSPYVVFVGSDDFHKNIDIILEVFRSDELGNLKLVLVGDNKSAGERCKKFINKDNVIFLGKISDAEVAKVISNAKALLCPSLLEGFGLPPLEAALHGVPSICSNRPALNEVLKNAAIFVEPTNISSWRQQIRRVISDSDLRETLVLEAQTVAKKFTWEIFLNNVLTHFHTLKMGANDVSYPSHHREQ
ncbi:MAG: hypothetical protein CBC42_05880 [Betaproteobacteria bacterium TMED82]|nr:MAG: hypothetical protein CBC42_05880 [Betaproteobacteria bacterium TMED82]